MYMQQACLPAILALYEEKTYNDLCYFIVFHSQGQTKFSLAGHYDKRFYIACKYKENKKGLRTLISVRKAKENLIVTKLSV